MAVARIAFMRRKRGEYFEIILGHEARRQGKRNEIIIQIRKR